MKRTTLLLICVLSSAGVFAQQATEALEKNSQTLRERYLVMKNKSENYQDYKVIKEYILDGVWKIIQDSLSTKQATLREARTNIARLEQELGQSQQALQAKEDSMKEIVHASTHITVLGIDFSKGFFAGMMGIIILLLGLTIAVIMYAMKSMRKNMAEKEELANAISAEYEDYKRKAMEKQTKLSRELQNERNKLMELGAL